MKRRALLIGNTNGLPGVPIDISKYTSFLKSDFGGQWNDEYEIITKMNPSKSDLLNTIKTIKNEKPDFAIIVFSGHGAYKKGTILEINEKEEYIYESDLSFISTRQISIFDCCRNIIPTTINENKALRGVSNFSKSYSSLRKIYDDRILQAIEQQVSLYACNIDESALDTATGGLYSSNLLNCSKPAQEYSFKLVGNAHQEAAMLTTNAAWITRLHKQNPIAVLPRCIASFQLIIGINPKVEIKSSLF